MILHNISDPIMELAKCLFYLRKQKMADFAFICFSIVFIFSRDFLFLYGFYLCSVTTLFKYKIFLFFKVLLICCCLLAVLNIFWTFFILKMVYLFIKTGSLKGDIRSNESYINKEKVE
ncbi:Ceramide synthase 4 [Dictyocoela muelleri]|nr:Ceramide synthase 4 [Dictyocoela muelleri]